MLALALRSLWVRRLTYGLVFVQLIIGIFCLTLAAALWDSTHAVERRARQVAPLTTLDAWMKSCPRVPFEAAMAKLRQDPAVAHVSVIYALGGNLDTLGFYGLDAATAELLPRKLSAGRWFGPADFQPPSSEIPVVLGAAVQPDMRPGSVISNDGLGPLMVIGRLKPGELFWHANGGRPVEAIVPADKMILLPATAAQRDKAGIPGQSYTVMARWLVFPRGSPEEAVGAMERVWRDDLHSPPFSETGMGDQTCQHTEPTTLAAGVQEYYQNNRQLLAAVAAIAAVILTIGLLGYSGVALVAVERRTREFALRLATGATTGDLAGQVLWEMVLLSMLAAAVGIPLAGLLARQAGYVPSGMVILFTFAVGTLEAVLAALGPMLTILRRPPAYFIRGGR